MLLPVWSCSCIGCNSQATHLRGQTCHIRVCHGLLRRGIVRGVGVGAGPGVLLLRGAVCRPLIRRGIGIAGAWLWGSCGGREATSWVLGRMLGPRVGGVLVGTLAHCVVHGRISHGGSYRERGGRMERSARHPAVLTIYRIDHLTLHGFMWFRGFSRVDPDWAFCTSFSISFCFCICIFPFPSFAILLFGSDGPELLFLTRKIHHHQLLPPARHYCRIGADPRLGQSPLSTPSDPRPLHFGNPLFCWSTAFSLRVLSHSTNMPIARFPGQSGAEARLPESIASR